MDCCHVSTFGFGFVCNNHCRKTYRCGGKLTNDSCCIGGFTVPMWFTDTVLTCVYAKLKKRLGKHNVAAHFFFFITFYTYRCVFTRRSKLLKHIESQSRFSHWWLYAFVCDASSTTLYRIFVLYIRLQFTLLTYFQIVTIFIHIQCEVSVTVLHIQFCIRAPLRHRCTWCITSYLIDATT